MILYKTFWSLFTCKVTYYVVFFVSIVQPWEGIVQTEDFYTSSADFLITLRQNMLQLSQT